jgi:hypothetical protein
MTENPLATLKATLVAGAFNAAAFKQISALMFTTDAANNLELEIRDSEEEKYLLFDGEAAGDPFVAGEVVTGQTSGATAKVRSLVSVLRLYNIVGSFEGNENITGDIVGDVTVNGTMGEVYFAYDAQVNAFVVGNAVTWNAAADSGICRGIQNDTPAGFLVLEDVTSLPVDGDLLVEGANTGTVDGTVLNSIVAIVMKTGLVAATLWSYMDFTKSIGKMGTGLLYLTVRQTSGSGGYVTVWTDE